MPVYFSDAPMHVTKSLIAMKTLLKIEKCLLKTTPKVFTGLYLLGAITMRNEEKDGTATFQL